VSNWPSFPDRLSYLWEWFWQIISGCRTNGMTPATIGWRDLDAWQRQMDVRLEPWEAAILVELGARRAAILSEEDGAKRAN
jgi:hypothetical protein